MLRNLLLLAAAICLMAGFSVQTRAQSIISGDVTGSVTDPTGASIPGATVTLTSVSTNASQKTTTNTQGSYRFAFVAPGTYQISVNATGFQNQTRSVLLSRPDNPLR